MEIKREERHGAGVFLAEEDGMRWGEMRYLAREGVMNIYHTEVDERMEGKHLGLKLVEAGVNYAREHGLKILPTCPFARRVFERTEAYRDVLVSD